MVRLVYILYRPFFHFFKQNDTMDVLDEKQNGAPPPMEVDEAVSVGDRKSLVSLLNWRLILPSSLSR